MSLTGLDFIYNQLLFGFEMEAEVDVYVNVMTN